MPKVRAYRKKDGTLVRAHSRGSISLGSFRHRVKSGSLGHLKHSGGARTPAWLGRAYTDWTSRRSYMDSVGNVRLYSHAHPTGKRGTIAPYSRRVKRVFHFGKGSGSRSMEFHHRAGRYAAKR